MIDWPSFFATHGVAYRDSGPNVSRGHIAIHCPFCGAADPSEHMSVAIDGAGWRCFRNDDHRGRSPVRLIVALIHCSFEQAARLAGVQSVPTGLLASVQARFAPQVEQKTAPLLTVPKEFRALNGSVRTLPFTSYLRRRGIAAVPDHYGLYCAVNGDFAGRVIFTVYHNGVLVSWTGRAIAQNATLRYRSLGDKPEDKPRALGPISDYLLWSDDAVGGKRLFVCEGPFDALKVRLLGERHGIHATCLFTSSASDAQIAALHMIAPRYDECCVLLDKDAFTRSLKLRSRLASLAIKIRWLPKGINDPAELTPADVPFLIA